MEEYKKLIENAKNERLTFLLSQVYIYICYYYLLK